MERPSSRNENELAREGRRIGHKRGCCSNCNSQIFCSYVLALISTSLVVGGVYLTVLHWDHVWLIFSGLGLILILIGSCMYYCGVQALRKNYCDDDDDLVEYGSSRRRRQKRCFRDRGLSGDELVPASAPQMGDNSSQLSLNMIPQYFSSRGESATSFATAAANASQSAAMAYNQNGQSCGQVFSVNGQSFLILPLTSTDSVTLSLQEASLNGLVVRMPTDKDSERKNDFVDFLKQPKSEQQLHQLSKRLEAGGTSVTSGPSVESELFQQQQSTSSQQHYGNLPARSEDINLVVLPSNDNKKSGHIKQSHRKMASEGTSAVRAAAFNDPNNAGSVACTSVNATSYFVSFRNSTNSPTITPRARTSNERNNQAANRTSLGAAPRSSVRRQATFKQVKPTVISVTPASGSQPADGGSSSSSSQNDPASGVLIELATTSSASCSSSMAITTAGAGNSTGIESGGSSTDPASSFHEDLYNEDDDADIDTNEEFTPPPSYDQALELDDPAQFVTISNHASESNETRGTF